MSEDALTEQDRLTELRTSARGWHGMQMALLGFVCLCGVLRRDDAGDPSWLQVGALSVAMAALLTALWAIVLIGRAAWPLYGAQPETATETQYDAKLHVASRQLSRGLALTFVSVALLALATASSWWPSKSSQAGLVEVRADSGETVCGELADAPEGELRVVSDGAHVNLPLQAVGSVRLVDSC